MFKQENIRSKARAGIVFPTDYKNGGLGITAYNGTGAALVIGKAYLLTYGGTEGQEVKIAAPATNTTFLQHVVVA
ncbi:MAG: hypothetical protein HOD11_08010, partial [Candidatus Marinimicrobia bacterium]|nr:hypothetical protein [Candidatus Neomarinimicrobiota bacterium]